MVDELVICMQSYAKCGCGQFLSSYNAPTWKGVDLLMSRITSPEAFFGHQLGADRKIARWDKIVDYYYLLAKESDRIQVIDLGPSTEGHPFLLTIISSPTNLANLEELRQINLQITDPRGQTEEAIKALVDKGKAVILQSMSLHASEIGGTQMAPELAYDLLTNDDAATKRILDNVIYLAVPCFNPDGQQMVTDWYNEWVGTEYEGASMPWLYHKFAGHDNNRDAFMQNLIESYYMGQLLFKKWRPQAFQDHHHMGSYGPRLYIAPYSEPIRPDADPLIWRELSWYGAHMAYKLEEAGLDGIINGAQFPAWGHFGYHWITNHHNIAGMLTESASAKLATPLYIDPSQLRGAGKTMPEYAPQTNFPNPWPGGWWHLRDIVERQKTAAWALLDVAARNRETVLWNSYLKAKRQTERGAANKTQAYIIAPEQHDALTARKLVQVLLNQGIEVQQATAAFCANARVYPEGTYLVSLAQPKYGVIKQLLGRSFYPDNQWTQNPDGSTSIFDSAADTVAEYMGVNIIPANQPLCGDFAVVKELAALQGRVCAEGSFGYVFNGSLNDSYRLANHLVHANVPVWRIDGVLHLDNQVLAPGAFYIESAAAQEAKALASQLGIDLYGLKAEFTGAKHAVQPLRVGLFQRYFGGNADEGWTRFVFEKFEQPYTTVKSEEIRAGNLRDKYDVLVIPSDWEPLIVDINAPGDKRAAMFRSWYGDSIPPQYKQGIGKEGVEAIRTFVKAGGRLVAMNNACDFAIKTCNLKVRNVVEGLGPKDYVTHGSTLHVDIATSDRLGYGMPEDALLLNWNSPVLQVNDNFRAENYRVIARYPASDILQSGKLVGEKLIAGKAAVIAAKYGQGEVVLFAFSPQQRGQTHGTFKLLFNCLQ